MTDLTRQSLGRYHILELIGEGGMANVYKAVDTQLERFVAIKVILASKLQSQHFLLRFEREAKALGQLSHPNIVKILDYGKQDDLPYLVMEYIGGGNLKDRLTQPMPWQEAARLLVPIARALEYAHQNNTIHRDVKPSNILLTESGQPLLADFGISKMLQSEETMDLSLTGTGMGVGTPEYMSPEQGLGKQIDKRSDIYSLGVVFYEMVTGRKPFEADTPVAVLVKQATEPLPRPRTFVRDLPVRVERVLLKALEKQPAQRFQSMGEFARALECLLQEQPAKGLPQAKKKIRSAINTSWKALFGGLSVLTIAGVLGGMLLIGSNMFGLPPNSPTRMVTNPETELALRGTITPTVERSVTPTRVSTISSTPTITITKAPITSATSTSTAFPQPITLNNIHRIETLYTFNSSDPYLDMSTKGNALVTSNYPFAFSSDGEILVGQTIELRRLDNGHFIQRLQAEDEYGVWRGSDLMYLRSFNTMGDSGIFRWIRAVALSPDKQYLAVSSIAYDTSIRIWNTDDGKLQKSVDGREGEVHKIVFSPDGKLMASASGANFVRLWNNNDTTIYSRRMSGPTGFKIDVTFTPDGKSLLIASYLGIHQLSLDNFQLSKIFDIGCSKISMNSDGTILSCVTDGNIIFFEYLKREMVHSLVTDERWVNVYWANDLTKIVTVSYRSERRIYYFTVWSLSY